MQKFNRPDSNQVTWHETDKRWLKAKGRAIRTMFDSTSPETGVARYLVAGVATIVIASTVGLSGVLAGPSMAGNALTSSLNPIGGLLDQFSGTPASAQLLEECGPVAADFSAGNDSSVEADQTLVVDNLPPLGPGDIPFDFPTVPPVGDPPADPEPPTEPPLDPEPPVEPEPPVADSEGDLIGINLGLAGENAVDLGILSGSLLGIDADSLDPDGTGTGSGMKVDLNGEEIATTDVDPQGQGIAATTINGDDPASVLEGDGTVAGLAAGILGDEPIAAAVGDEPIAGLLGDEPVAGLLN